MASPNLIDLLPQLPGNFGDVQGMKLKAAQLAGVAGRLEAMDRALVRAAAATTGYQGPAAGDFRAAIETRHEQSQRVVGRLAAATQRLNRAASIIDHVGDEVNAIRRRIERDAATLGADADRLVRDAQQLAGGLGRL
ncbi:MAG: hypothetical protein ACR2MY_10485 [Candidatus Dormibacteria bacterium]